MGRGFKAYYFALEKHLGQSRVNKNMLQLLESQIAELQKKRKKLDVELCDLLNYKNKDLDKYTIHYLPGKQMKRKKIESARERKRERE